MIDSGKSDYTNEASKAVRELGGYFAIDSVRLDLESSALMTRIKDQLDPDGVFV
jgi:FAD/FMN-containing dehydrogenase